MAYIYKTILRRENYIFDAQTLKKNSRQTEIFCSHRKNWRDSFLYATVDNKTADVRILLPGRFSEKTENEIKQYFTI